MTARVRTADDAQHRPVAGDRYIYAFDRRGDSPGHVDRVLSVKNGIVFVTTHAPGEDEEDFEDEYPIERWAEGNGTWVPVEAETPVVEAPRTAADAQHRPQPGDRWIAATQTSPEGHETRAVHTVDRVEGDIVHVICTYSVLLVDWSEEHDAGGDAGVFEPGGGVVDE